MNTPQPDNPPPPDTAAGSPRSSVLHLVEAVSPQTCGVTLALLAQLRELAGERSTVLLMGGPPLTELAEAVQLRGARRFGVPYGRATCGLTALRRQLRTCQPERIICWSVGALLAARLLKPDTPRTLVVTQPMRAEEGRWLRRCLRWPGNGDTQVVTAGDQLRDALIQGALAGGEDRVKALPMVPVGVKPGATGGDIRDGLRLPGKAKGDLRKRWGLMDPQVKVIALLADPPTAADAQAAALTTGLAHTVLRDSQWRGDVALVVHPDQWRRRQARKMVAQLGNVYTLVLDADIGCPWRILSGCDAALTLGSTAGGLSMGAAMAAGVPVVADPSASAKAWLEHGRTGLVAGDRQPRSLAHQLTVLLREPNLAGRMGLASRYEAARRSAVANWLPWLEHLEGCGQIVGAEAPEPLAAPQPGTDAARPRQPNNHTHSAKSD